METLYQAACLWNDNGEAEGYVTREEGLTQAQWDGKAEDLEAAWGVYQNRDGDEEGHWGERTPESLAAFDTGPMEFLAWMVGGQAAKDVPPGPVCNIHWI